MSWRIERSVEIPIVWQMVEKTRQKRILEVGNVLSHYFTVRHDVVDKYEKADGVLNCDIMSFRPEQPYDLIVSISTLEHVGYDEEIEDPTKCVRAVEQMKSCLAPGGTLAITAPLGYNKNLDRLLREGAIPFTSQALLKRISRRNDWVEANWEDVKDARQDYPYLWANAVFVGIYRKPSVGDGRCGTT
jgi:trans-aconitate methyltransferase